MSHHHRHVGVGSVHGHEEQMSHHHRHIGVGSVHGHEEQMSHHHRHVGVGSAKNTLFMLRADGRLEINILQGTRL
jgi:hypothetical protein